MPPLVGEAVKVTLVPEQIVLPGFAVILTDGVTNGFIVMVIKLDVTVAELGQAILLVITQLITSP